MKVLIACEYSGITRTAFEQLGHDAWSCDLLPLVLCFFFRAAEHFKLKIIRYDKVLFRFYV